MTLQELYDKVMASDALKNSFAEAAQDKGKLEAWLKEQGSDATVEQMIEFLKTKQTSGELSDDELENVAGGNKSGRVVSSLLFVGVGCGIAAAASAAVDDMGVDWCFENIEAF